MKKIVKTATLGITMLLTSSVFAKILTQSDLAKLIKDHKPTAELYFKDAPTLVYPLVEQTSLSELPDSVVKYLGETDWKGNPYNDEYIEANQGGAIGIQWANGSPDLYIIDQETFSNKYGLALPIDEVKTKNSKTWNGISNHAELKDLLQDENLEGRLKLAKVKIVKLSDLGLDLDTDIKIVPHWEGKPQNKTPSLEGYIVIEEKNGKSLYYLVNEDKETGNPIAYIKADEMDE